MKAGQNNKYAMPTTKLKVGIFLNLFGIKLSFSFKCIVNIFPKGIVKLYLSELLAAISRDFQKKLDIAQFGISNI